MYLLQICDLCYIISVSWLGFTCFNIVFYVLWPICFQQWLDAWIAALFPLLSFNNRDMWMDWSSNMYDMSYCSSWIGCRLASEAQLLVLVQVEFFWPQIWLVVVSAQPYTARYPSTACEGAQTLDIHPIWMWDAVSCLVGKGIWGGVQCIIIIDKKAKKNIVLNSWLQCVSSATCWNTTFTC
jgi:hypothetical protein